MTAATPRVMVALSSDTPRTFLAENLEADRFAPVPVTCLQHASCRLSDHIDLLIVDLGKDTVQLVESIRNGELERVDPQLPILALTDISDRLHLIRLLERGADDAIFEPWSYPEVHARVKALLRRAQAHQHRTVVNAGTLRVDLSAHRVWVGDTEIEGLAPKEFELLSALLRDPKRVFTRTELLQSVWGIGDQIRTRTLDVHIARLRSRLNIAGESFVSNVWGVGYRLVI
jgi:two-component system phosphate regulon response regulator PhoB